MQLRGPTWSQHQRAAGCSATPGDVMRAPRTCVRCPALIAARSSAGKGPKIVWECSACGGASLRFLGRCPECGKLGTLEKVETWPQSSQRGGGAGVSAVERLLSAAPPPARAVGVPDLRPSPAPSSSASDADADDGSAVAARSGGWMSGRRAAGGRAGTASRPVSLHELSKATFGKKDRNRLVLTGRTGHEINRCDSSAHRTACALRPGATSSWPPTDLAAGVRCRVLGGGVVTGSLVLMGGEPGVGKSTLSLQASTAPPWSQPCGRRQRPNCSLVGRCCCFGPADRRHDCPAGPRL